MKKWLTIALALTVALVGALVLTQGGDEGHAATKSRVTSVFGVKEASAGDLIIHITALVPPGVSERVVADAALNAQRARRATPADLQSADFTTTGLIWNQFSDGVPGNDFVTQFYNNSKDPNGIDGQSALTNTQATWKAVSTSSFTLSLGGQTSRCPSLVDECRGPQTFDGLNDVTFLNLAGPRNAVFGCTLGVTWFSTSVDEADMALNTKASWVHDCNSSGSPFDGESVVLHENGHVGGLGHSGDANAVMATPYSSAQCDLHQDDIDGISALYPGSGATPAPTPVPTATPVPTPTPAPASAIVESISYSTVGGRFGDAHLVVGIAVTDGGGLPVSGASVSADLNLDGASFAARSGTTGADGSAALKFTNAPAGCYDTAVTSVTGAGLTWDETFPANGLAKGGATC